MISTITQSPPSSTFSQGCLSFVRAMSCGGSRRERLWSNPSIVRFRRSLPAASRPRVLVVHVGGTEIEMIDLLHNMQFFIVAGHETTALLLAWALLLVANDEAVRSRARAEAKAAIGNRPATADDLARSPYIEQILQETLRLYPPVALLARNVIAPDQIYDREIRPGDTVFLNIYSLHRHHLWWENPNAFEPDNFTPQKVAARDRYLHLPFGAGARICIGANFAMMQAQIILTTLLSRFSFHPAGPAPTPVMHMTVRPEPGVWLEFTPDA